MCRPFQFYNCHDAISAGNYLAPVGIGWRPAKSLDPGYWFLFSLTEGCPIGFEVEFVCIGLGRYPIPVSDDARTIVSAMMAKNRYDSDPRYQKTET